MKKLFKAIRDGNIELVKQLVDNRILNIIV